MNTLKVSIQDISDSLSGIFPGSIVSQIPEFELVSVRLYQEGTDQNDGYLYIAEGKTFPAVQELTGSCAYLLCGRPEAELPDSIPCIILPGSCSMTKVFSAVQDVFEKFNAFEKTVRESLLEADPLDDMLEAAAKLLGNPIYLHDPEFYILSSPCYSPDIPVWERDIYTGRLMAPSAMIESIRHDALYWDTIDSRRAELYSSERAAHRVFYYNLRDNEKYIGRICLLESSRSFRDGDGRIISWLGGFIIECVRSRNLLWLGETNMVQNTFRRIVNGEDAGNVDVTSVLRFLRWDSSDLFLCMHMEVDLRQPQTLSAASTIGCIGSIIPQSVAFSNQNGITIVVDLTQSGNSISETVSSLTVLLRENLFKMGVSFGFHDIECLGQAFFQAKKALELGERNVGSSWYYLFKDHVLDYVLQNSIKDLSPRFVACQELLQLQDYDRENDTDLYHTLQVYLRHERNAVKASEELFIHRSTLFYRLNRIKSITKADLDDPRVRIMLQLSYYIHENGV